MTQNFYSNGKLLITGEYLVLDGAKALALPTKFGQSLELKPSEKGEISWQSFDSDGALWFESKLCLDAVTHKKTTASEPIQSKLIEILHEAHRLNPSILDTNNGFAITTRLTFPRKWGLGTSSTLINNVAQWFNINAFELLNRSFGGSGYDIACAQTNQPIIYNLLGKTPTVENCNFAPLFSKNLHFVYLNQKQNSGSAIQMYRQKATSVQSEINGINTITEKMIDPTIDFNTFCTLLQDHEQILSQLLGLPTVQNQLFPDFDGVVKSLGAWGGDFVLVAAKKNPTDYFAQKGFRTVLPFDKMIL